MMDGSNIAGQGIVARATLGGDRLKMQGGEVFSALSATELENRQTALTTEVCA